MTSVPDTSAPRLGLAAAVAAPGRRAMLLDRQNRSAGRCGLDEAVADDAVFAVQVASHLVAVDVDDDPGQLDRLADAAFAAGVPHVMCASGQDGRGHVWLVVGDRLDRDTAHRLHQALRGVGDLRRPGSWLRPPGGRHRLDVVLDGVAHPRRSRPLGETSAALAVLTGPPASPRQVDALVDALADGRPSEIAPRTQLPRRRRSLPRRLQTLLAGPMPEVPHRGVLLGRASMLAAHAGLRPDEWLDLVAGTWVWALAREKQPASPPRYLTRAYERACDTVAAGGCDTDAARHARTMRSRLLDADAPPARTRWWRTSGLAVVDAVLELVAATGRLTLDLAVRDVAESAGVSRSAAHRALQRLGDRGVLVAEGRPAPGSAEVWRVGLAALGAWTACPTTPRETPRPLPEAACAARSADCWGWEGTVRRSGWLAWLAWRQLRPPPGPAGRLLDVLAARLGLSRGWIGTLLRRLRALRIDADADDVELEAAARADGTDGRIAAMAERHAQERAAVSGAALAAVWLLHDPDSPAAPAGPVTGTATPAA